MVLAEKHRIRRKLEAAQESEGVVDEVELAKRLMDQQVRAQMGPLLYYLTPWNRVRMQVKIEKRKEIEAALAEKVEKGEDEQDEGDIDIEIK